ncbi:4'-phosphopantetheinyl transferase superfamily protein [Imperialibacter roseus]|uniref:4'-phosphopantetheinyl transferase superfamily protein n=1 Tax=Imperialibacter roseus TaxID=1324217 RepID=A0ABZ0IU50_9BACT|nr:4'-phosphopantetheinyl transferase superfamily protein [Imperialibacter roseus]WOK08568.1 4'-phosphopantetheinyl transferase superfamily protein [Imperialibacter roseus]
MIGVDIVDLTDQLLKPRSRREIRFISHPNDHCPKGTDEETNYWLLWAAKEAIFKAERSDKAFSPRQIEVVYSETEGDRLRYRGKWLNEINGYSVLKKDSIFSVAATANIAAVKWKTFMLNTPNQSQELRDCFQREMGPGYQVLSDAAGLPTIKHDGTTTPASVSHHHHLGIVAWMES